MNFFNSKVSPSFPDFSSSLVSKMISAELGHSFDIAQVTVPYLYLSVSHKYKRSDDLTTKSLTSISLLG